MGRPTCRREIRGAGKSASLSRSRVTQSPPQRVIRHRLSTFLPLTGKSLLSVDHLDLRVHLPQVLPKPFRTQATRYPEELHHQPLEQVNRVKNRLGKRGTQLE